MSHQPFVLTALAAASMFLSASASAAVTRGGTPQPESGVQLVPSGKGYGIPAEAGAARAAVVVGHGIDYHGGPVMKAAGGVKVYVIWYGDWAGKGGPNAKTIINDLFSSVGGTPYYNINTTYWQTSDTAKNRVKNKVTLAGAIDDAGYSLGKSLTDANIETLVSNAITSGKFPRDKNGLYFVLTTKDVNETSGFCTQYCGWHWKANILGTQIKYSFVGDAARCLGSCAVQTVSPNGNPGVDGMASVIVHELEEAATDPLVNAWYDSSGMENADKCAWTFGSTSTLPGGAQYNVSWGARKFMIQQNWVNAGAGSCALQYP